MLGQPIFRSLERPEVEVVLARNVVARLAYSFHDRVDVEPIHYAWDDGVLFGRLGPGTKLRTLLHHPWVALEVDEVRGLYSWCSVVAKGTVYFLEDDGPPMARAEYARAVKALQRLDPRFFTDADPVPERGAIFRVQATEFSGREASQQP
jgi:nitroimidazol reductase NimA-like FMN-containing flavoprotein (pyridoxamine 5'-phosphate oxidase superfamily)